MPHPKFGYKLKDGTKVPGVTTIIGRFKDSGGLLWWAFEMGKLAEQGMINSLYDKRDEAADSGTLAHEMVENYINGDDPYDVSILVQSTVDVIEKAKQGFENYLTWEKDNKIKVIKQEIQLVSDTYRFGGCPDAIGINSKGERVILDWKTSNSVYSDMLIQLAAYRYLWEENYPDQLITGGFHLCRFSKEYADFSHHYWSELDDAWEQFKLFRKAYDIDKLLKKRTG